MKTLLFKQKTLIVASLFVSTNFCSQTFWTEDFGISNAKGDKGNMASNYSGSNGAWTLSYETENGKNANQWFVSSMETGMSVGSCNKNFNKATGSGNNTLHIGKVSGRALNAEENGMGDVGAYYSISSNALTDVMAESPVINCTNKQSIRLSFDYFCGAKSGAVLMVYYNDGSQWELLDKLGMTKAGNCDTYGKMMWLKSDTYTLPGSFNNNPKAKIGFRWINDSVSFADPIIDAINPGSVTKFYSAAIDNITISGATYADPNNNAAKAAGNNNKIDIKTQTVADKKNNPNIVFTTYSEKFPANDLIIESSADGSNFNELTQIKSKAVKGSITKLEYNFTDAQANDGVNYYRIKQVNADKTTVISKVVSVDHIKAKNITFTVYPNPNSGQFTVDFSGIENNHEVQIVLNDMNDGHEIYSTTFYSNSIDSNKIDVNPPTKIAPGRYVCSLIFEGIRSSVIVMIN